MAEETTSPFIEDVSLDELEEAKSYLRTLGIQIPDTHREIYTAYREAIGRTGAAENPPPDTETVTSDHDTKGNYDGTVRQRVILNGDRNEADTAGAAGSWEADMENDPDHYKNIPHRKEPGVEGGITYYGFHDEADEHNRSLIKGAEEKEYAAFVEERDRTKDWRDVVAQMEHDDEIKNFHTTIRASLTPEMMSMTDAELEAHIGELISTERHLSPEEESLREESVAEFNAKMIKDFIDEYGYPPDHVDLAEWIKANAGN